MEFKNKLEIPIKLEKDKKKKLDETIAKIISEITKINNQMQKNNQIKKSNLEGLINKESDASLFFGYQFNVYDETEMITQKNILNEELKKMYEEKYKIDKKIEKMEKLFIERKKEFENQLRKKEEKESEEMKVLIKQKEVSGDAEY